jgi:hypothetical protein
LGVASVYFLQRPASDYMLPMIMRQRIHALLNRWGALRVRLVVVCESVLQICMPELVNSTRLSQNLPCEGILKQRHKPHPASLQEERYFSE